MSNHIKIIGTGPTERLSTLIATDPKALRVSGILPHNYEFVPADVENAIKLRDWADAYIKANKPISNTEPFHCTKRRSLIEELDHYYLHSEQIESDTAHVLSASDDEVSKLYDEMVAEY